MVSALLFGCTGLAVADSHEADGPSFNPVEGWTCNYNDGKGPADLDKTVAAWNEWMDDKGQGDYFAVTMTPNYFGERAFDVAWVGVWRDGNAMGRGADLWINEGGEIADGFSEVLTCDSHANFASQNVKQPELLDSRRQDHRRVHGGTGGMESIRGRAWVYGRYLDMVSGLRGIG
jgi:hypothetical protein